MKKLSGLVLALLLAVLSFSALCENDGTDIFGQFDAWVKEGGLAEFGANMGQALSEGYLAVSQSVKDTVNIAGEYLSQLSSEFDRETEKAWKVLMETADKTVSHTKEEVEKAWVEIEKWVEENGNRLDENLRSAIDYVGSAAGVAEAQVSIWLRTVEETFTENSEKVTVEAQKAWATVEQAVQNVGSVTSETLTEAYETVRTWIDSLNQENAVPAREALDDLMAQAQLK